MENYKKIIPNNNGRLKVKLDYTEVHMHLIVKNYIGLYIVYSIVRFYLAYCLSITRPHI